MTTTLLALAIIFTQLSLLAFGGGNSILPEMHRQVVDVQHERAVLKRLGLEQRITAPIPDCPA